MTQNTIQRVLQKAVETAIEEVGLETFKRTSMFISSNRIDATVKAAA